MRANTIETYEKNFRPLYGNREKIWKDPSFSSAGIGVHIMGGISVSLGGMLRAIDTHPELFRVGENLVICHYFGSPLSGTTVCRVVNLDTGKVRRMILGRYDAKTSAILEAVKEFPVSEAAMPLSDLVSSLV